MDKSYNFGDIVQLVVKDRVVKAHSITAEDMGRYFHRFLYDHLLLIIAILRHRGGGDSAAISGVTSLGYAGIVILFSMRYDGLRVNTRIWPSRSYKWWNGELFRILPMSCTWFWRKKLRLSDSVRETHALERSHRAHRCLRRRDTFV